MTDENVVETEPCMEKHHEQNIIKFAMDNMAQEVQRCLGALSILDEALQQLNDPDNKRPADEVLIDVKNDRIHYLMNLFSANSGLLSDFMRAIGVKLGEGDL